MFLNWEGVKPMDSIFYGLLTGSILLLASVGFSMVRKTEGFLNIAHGQFMALGAFLTYHFNVNLGLGFVVSGVFTIIICCIFGVLIARLIYDPLKNRGPVANLFSSIAVAYIIYGVIIVLWGGSIKTFGFDINPIKFGKILTVTPIELIIILVALLAALGLHFFLTKTTQGNAIRAMSCNYNLARFRGVMGRLVSTYVWLIASGLAAVAGILVALKGSIYPDYQ